MANRLCCATNTDKPHLTTCGSQIPTLRNVQLLVGEFMVRHGMPRCTPTAVLLRASMVMEELAELTQAYVQEPEGLDTDDLVDGLGDLAFTVLGLAWTLNLDLEPLLLEVCRSNLTKEVSPGPRVKDKGSGYEPPCFEGKVRSYPRG